MPRFFQFGDVRNTRDVKLNRRKMCSKTKRPNLGNAIPVLGMKLKRFLVNFSS